MENQFNWKTNLAKAGQAFAIGAIPAALICLQDDMSKGSLDTKKVLIGLALSVSLAGLKSLQNWLKNRNPAEVVG